MLTLIRRTALVAIAASIIAAPAVAAPLDTASDPRTARVALNDLDLREDADVTRLQGRIRMAANSVCGSLGRMPLAQMNKVRQCRQTALTTANRDADAIVVAVRSGKDQRVAVREHLRVVAR